MKNVYLEKIAEKKEESRGQVGKGLAAATLGAIPVLPLGLIHHQANKKMIKSFDSPHSESNLGTIKKMMRDNKLNVTFNTRDHSLKKNTSNNKMGAQYRSAAKHFDSPFYAPSGSNGTKDIIAGVKRKFGNHPGTKSTIKNTDVIMHELGHAKDFSKHKKLKSALLHSSRAGAVASVGALMHKDTRDHATTIAAVSAIPTLRSEAAANYHAYNGIKAHKGAASANRFARKFVPLQMTGYALGAASSVGSIYAGKRLLDHWDKKK